MEHLTFLADTIESVKEMQFHSLWLSDQEAHFARCK